MANKIRITIGGIQYSVISEDSQEYLSRLGRELELRMDHLAKKNPFLSTTMIAVLAALEGMDSAKKESQENERLRSEVNRLLEELAMARSEISSYQRKLQEVSHNND